MKAALATFELMVGLAYGFASLIVLGSLAGISTPIWGSQFVLYWACLFAGPTMLVVGAVLTLAGPAQKPAAVLTMLGSATLTGWALYLASSVPGERARGVMNLGLVVIVLGVVLAALTSNLAAYKIYRLVGKVR